MKNLLHNKYILIAAMMVIGGFIGWFIKPSNNQIIKRSDYQLNENVVFTCSMHPQIRQPEPGKCPICGMDLIPLNTEHSEENPLEIKMSPTAMQLANVQTSIITKQKPVKEVRMNGRIKVDERKIFSQTSHIPGRIEKLLVSFTGEKIEKGQVLTYIYSPDLVNAQEELLEAFKTKNSQPTLYRAARQKLLNWKLREEQIDQIIENGELMENFPVLADMSGIVLDKEVNLGDHVRQGQTLFKVADLSNIWVLFDVYESDIPWVKKGNEVVFTVQSLPGEIFKGNITFVDPVINPKTRVATARVEMANPGLKLKPDMFAVGIVKSPIDNMERELIVPKSAVMWTGERSVVYVKESSVSGISFMMQEITLGPALGDSYIVKDGLEEGVEIATNGTFSIDAAAQLAGKPSMMNPEGGPVSMAHNHGNMSTGTQTSTAHSQNISVSRKVKETLFPLFQEYLDLKDALVTDDYETSKQIAARLHNNLNQVNMGIFVGEAHDTWMQHSTEAVKALRSIDRATSIGEVRQEFKLLSDEFIMLALAFGPFDKELFIQHCPMANERKGADWVSDEKEIQNPYFGESMIGCGNVTREIK